MEGSGSLVRVVCVVMVVLTATSCNAPSSEVATTGAASSASHQQAETESPVPAEEWWTGFPGERPSAVAIGDWIGSQQGNDWSWECWRAKSSEIPGADDPEQPPERDMTCEIEVTDPFSGSYWSEGVGIHAFQSEEEKHTFLARFHTRTQRFDGGTWYVLTYSFETCLALAERVDFESPIRKCISGEGEFSVPDETYRDGTPKYVAMEVTASPCLRLRDRPDGNVVSCVGRGRYVVHVSGSVFPSKDGTDWYEVVVCDADGRSLVQGFMGDVGGRYLKQVGSEVDRQRLCS